MQLSDAIYKRIKYYMKLNNIITWWDLYKVTGVPKSTINAIFCTKKTKIPRLITLTQLCYGLNTNLQDFFNDPIFFNIDDNM